MIKGLRKLWNIKAIRHISYWLISYLFLYTVVRVFENHELAVKIATVLTVPAPLTVYLHYFVLRRFFEKRRYLLYILSTVAIIAMTEVTVQSIHRQLEKNPDSHTSGVGAAIFYITFSTGFMYYFRGVKQQYRLQEVESKQLQTELALLKSQINPHFFFNTLNNLYALSLDKSDRVPGTILKLSELMRYALDSSKKKTVSLEDEMRFMENYVELERLRLDERVDITLKRTGHFNGQQIAPMILIPFLENSFKHGVSATSGGGWLRIDAEMKGDRFHFHIENSKRNRLLKREEGTGLGLANVSRRLQMLYAGRHELTIDDGKDRFLIDLEMRL